ncbi:MAG: 50S ribosomal protein L21 [Candidatus Omnitrophota bacterium]|nr:MAG: 50S ribosomal protein L21 [Candidatus Omnitrophota bacterium]
MWAVVEIGKKQYLVNKGDLLEVERLKGQKGKVQFDKVLLLADKKNIKVGSPYIKDALVKAEIQEEKKGKKVTIYKYKRRKKYRKKQGHRQIYTPLKITSITTTS